MSDLAEIKPKDRLRLIDLVEAAGVDVRGWASFERGERWAAANPKYCYEWAFVEPGKVVVLCLWYASMQERDGTIVQDLDARETARKFGRLPKGALGKSRALRMDLAIQSAFREGLPIRVVVCEGERRDLGDPDSSASKVHKRLLDSVTWAVESYDVDTGQCTLIRGVLPDRFADQFSVQSDSAVQAEWRDASGRVFVRSAEIRRRVRERAQGKCEWCGELGFEMEGGKFYIETHHVVALAEGGLDREDNVVALCPKHHREAHHGLSKDMIRRELLGRLTKMISAEPGACTRPAGFAVRR